MSPQTYEDVSRKLFILAVIFVSSVFVFDFSILIAGLIEQHIL